MGRHLKPISDRKPAKQLALKLRELKGNVPFARLAKQVHVKPNTLSTMADGTYRGWECVEQFLRAVELCGGVVTEEDRSQCRALHKSAEQLHRARGGPSNSTASSNAMLQPTVETVVLAPRVADDSGSDVVTFTRIEPILACPSSLAQARTVHDIVTSLLDLITEKNKDIQSWRQQPPGSWPAGRTGTAEWEVLTGRRQPTPQVILSIVQQCGGTHADLARWLEQWNRIVRPATRFVGRAKAPEHSRASEPRVALAADEPVSDTDLQRIRDRLNTPKSENPPQMSLWRRLTARARITRKLTRRSPGETLPPDRPY
jgi:hypothetical protein